MALAKRCNLALDCDDGSDEINCLIVDIDENKYHIHDPPVIEGNKTVVEIGIVYIHSFLLLEQV